LELENLRILRAERSRPLLAVVTCLVSGVSSMVKSLGSARAMRGMFYQSTSGSARLSWRREGTKGDSLCASDRIHLAQQVVAWPTLTDSYRWGNDITPAFKCLWRKALPPLHPALKYGILKAI